MKNAARIIPCYSADTSGVCSALYELGGLTVVHDASGCNSTYSTHDEPRWYDMRSNIFISALTEMDAIMGNDEKLIADTVSAAKDRKPAFIALCGSPMPMMTGVDFDAVAAEVEARSGIRTFGLHTNGTRSYIEGASEALAAVVREYAEPCGKVRGRVNVLGLTPLDLPLGADKHIREWLASHGFECGCTLAMGDSLESIKKLPSAEVNLLVSEAGRGAAEYLKKEYGIPCICGVPFGNGFADELAERLRSAANGSKPVALSTAEAGQAEVIVIGEGISAMSLAEALRRDLGLNAGAINTQPSEGAASGDVLSCEEDIEAALLELRPKAVVADPLYRYILPAGTRLIEVPHFAFSGRCFQRAMVNLINTDIKEYFK
ncbi:MAG: oxalate:formate antiporter [Ruminococcus sp.]|nr:oxalate:formate antiporter [Ruminococcus sp.]